MIHILDDKKNIGYAEQINIFIDLHGEEKLKQILKDYTLGQEFYECRHKMDKNIIRIMDIQYLEIFIHEIQVHTHYGIFIKYGNLTTEEGVLRKYGFIRCNQSYLISLRQIKSYSGNKILLYTGEVIFVSKSYKSNFNKVIYDIILNSSNK